MSNKEKKENPMSLYIVQGINMTVGILATLSEPKLPWWFFIVLPAAGYGLGFITLYAKNIVDIFYPPVMHVTKPRITYLYVNFLVKYILPPILTLMVWLVLGSSYGI